MGWPTDPRRRHSPQVYRMRRAVAASALVLVVFAIWEVAGPSGGQEAAVTTTSSSTSSTLPALPACSAAENPVPQDPKTAWATILVDTARSLPATYGPGDLHNIADAGFPLTDGVTLRGFVMPDLRALREAAAANGTPIKVIVGYRSFQSQQLLFDKRTDELGASEAGSRVARPGHSEHQLGTTLDITSEGLTDVDQSWGATPTGQWIASHAHEYGFILSYPAEASASTCYDYEPWHLRYVGRDEAADVIRQRVTLRQYLWDLDQGVTALPATSSTASTTTTTKKAG
jgi:D-alanyl-D-alanine carboxypeptidase